MNPRPDGAAQAAPRRGPLRRFARRVLAEPLTHFVLIGLAIFLAAQTWQAVRRPVVKIDGDEMTQLVTYWELQSQRAPTEQELRSILRERIDEEILAKEALRRGLDKDDIIIRRRLAQKMAFAGEDSNPLPEPSDAQLRDLWARNGDRWDDPERTSFEQLFFSANRGEAAAQAAARAALAGLQSGKPVAAAGGDPFVLPLTPDDLAAIDILRDYGPDFTAAVRAAPVGRWTGPVHSAFGYHLVRVTRRTPSHRPDFAVVRPQLREAWINEARQKANQAFMDDLRRKYRVVAASLPGGKPPPAPAAGAIPNED